MVVCLMRITAKSRKLIAIADTILCATMIFLETFLVLLKFDKISEFSSIGVFDYLREHDLLFLSTMLITGILLLFSVFLLIFVFDVAVSQENASYRVTMSNYSSSMYLIIVSLILCVLSFSLSIRVSTEFDHKMTKLLMTSYLNYEKSPDSRKLADRIHMEYSCCGVNSIEDFVDLSEVDKKLAPQTKLWSCDDWEYCGVPLSCCKSTSCSHKVALLTKGWEPTDIMSKWFNRAGCVSEMNNSGLLFGVSEPVFSHFIMVLVLGFHLCCLVLTQILVTASATLNTSRLEFSDSSYAWLIDVGQPDSRGVCLMLNPDLQLSPNELSPSSHEKPESHEAQVPEEPETGDEGITGAQTEMEEKIEGETAELKPTDVSNDTADALNGTSSSSTNLSKGTASSSNENLLKPLGKKKTSESATKESSSEEKARKTTKKPGKAKKPVKKAKGKASKNTKPKQSKPKPKKSKSKPTPKKTKAPKKKSTTKLKKK